MDSSLLQLDNIHEEISILLCQYTYFLNKEASKALFLGFNPSTFRPVLHITSLIDNKQLEFTNEDWACVTACSKYCIKFLSENSDLAWYSSNTLVIESIYKNSERLIRISFFDSPDSFVELNLYEFEIINQYSTFISRIFKHYSDYWTEIDKYYRQYLLKCITLNKTCLDQEDYFLPNNRCLNYYRIFNELPIVCRNKLINDLTP